MILFSLAKAEEDLGNIDEASKYLIEANKIKKELTNYNIKNEIDLINNIKQLFTQLEIKTLNSIENNVIFIQLFGISKFDLSCRQQRMQY